MCFAVFRPSAGGRVFGLLLAILWVWGCATTPVAKHTIRLETSPSDALVSIGDTNPEDLSSGQLIAGTTPLEKEFDFGSADRIWLTFEKRGFLSKKVSVVPNAGHLSVHLERRLHSDGSPFPEFEMPPIKRLLLAEPKFSYIQRGFSGEKISPDLSAQARQALMAAINRQFGDRWVTVSASESSDGRQLKSLWRDGNTAMELTNPIRLRYQSEPVMLETTSGRKATWDLGHRHQTDAVLLITGKQIVETGSMVAGKIGMTVIGTASSYAGGYSRAMANGDSFFVYTIYTPQFSEGMLLKAALISCRDGEVLWTNQGLWKPVDFANETMMGNIMIDLLSGLIDHPKGEKQ
jgi:hypothetical protein